MSTNQNTPAPQPVGLEQKMEGTPRTDGHKLLDRLLIISLAKDREAARIIADRIEEQESQLAAMTAERDDHERARNRLTKECDLMQNSNHRLETALATAQKEIERLTLNGLHTCHAECQRPLCVLTRQNEELKRAQPINTHVRLFDLVRCMRSELHAAELITDEEFNWICAEAPLANDPKIKGSPSPRRLEDYDAIRQQLTAALYLVEQMKGDSTRLDGLKKMPGSLRWDEETERWHFTWSAGKGHNYGMSHPDIRAAIDTILSCEEPAALTLPADQRKQEEGK